MKRDKISKHARFYVLKHKLPAAYSMRTKVSAIRGTISKAALIEQKEAESKSAGRREILSMATRRVCGVRQRDYGSPEDNFKAIAAFWRAYKGIDFNAIDVAIMMALMKIARIQSGTATEDSFIDLAGYAACGGELAQKDDSTE